MQCPYTIADMINNKKDIDWQKLQFGTILLDTKGDKRILTLIDNYTFDTVGEINYFVKTGKGEGRIGKNKIRRLMPS